MDTIKSLHLQQYKNVVGIKFQLYNSLFSSLPFHTVERTGILNSLLLLTCEDGYEAGKSPEEIIQQFFESQKSITTQEQQIDILFKIVQYIERQVVLFDALEDAAFKQVRDWGGAGSLKQLGNLVYTQKKEAAFENKLKDFSIQLVLTAHPTQFYTGAVLGIIHDLANAVANNNETLIYTYLQQLGRTPFYKKNKPTPYDEAVSLIWYLENVFYAAVGRIITYMKSRFGNLLTPDNSIIKMGFWPGGDRDGNPYVTADTTLKVATALRGAIIKCYYQEVRKLKRRLTFKEVDVLLAHLEEKLYKNLFIPDYTFDISKQEILDSLQAIHALLIQQHSGLFEDLVQQLINKVEVFGIHFASIDIRQDSSIHAALLHTLAQHTNILPSNYANLSNLEKIALLQNITEPLNDFSWIENSVQKDVLAVMQAIKNIQQMNGEAGCNRYIISHCESALNVIEVFTLFRLAGFKQEEIKVDIIPLFETIDDLQHAKQVMQELYQNKLYYEHLQKRGQEQTIMLGFSDGTKDGGYLMANWAIYQAKEALSAISKEHHIQVKFFDGRGGPPARGGGKTHNFYASLGKSIANKAIQLTIQGQTVSSNFGTIDAAQYNIEQLLNAGIVNDILENQQYELNTSDRLLIDNLAKDALEAYNTLKEHPSFIAYLMYASPLKYYAETNIGSRPAKRGQAAQLSLNDLRAIPYVGAWSQLKQNVTGFYGVGTALKNADNNGDWLKVKELYTNSLFFRTLLDNCEMALKKCYLPLTQYLSANPMFSEVYGLILNEYHLTVAYIIKLTGHQALMHTFPVDQLSIQMRERIVLPLLTIQQYALAKIREIELKNIDNQFYKEKNIYEKLVIRCSFGIINAARNSA
jgi:phosphoenolpyruvate carboxylase